MKDIQSCKDFRNIKLPKAGVKSVRLPFLILEQSGGYQQVSATVSLSSDLSPELKGTHMSRYMEILNHWSQKSMSGHEIKEILEETKKKLQTGRAEFEMKFVYFIYKTAPVSGSSGLLDYMCGFKGVYEDQFQFSLTMEVPISTVCPCSKAISQFGAHNQRAIVRLELGYDRADHVWFEDLADNIAKAGSTELYPILKRPDEKEVTETGYSNPKFVEDVVRDVAIYLRSIDGVKFFTVECESMESIHSHNAFAYLSEKC